MLTENDLNKIVHISLEETETFWFYEQAGVRVSGEAEDSEDIMYVFRSSVKTLSKYLFRVLLIMS